jgi:uncharacterized membrane protein
VSDTDTAPNYSSKNSIAKLPLLAAIVALIGVCDASYLTYHHYMAMPVPCSITGGCEEVLTSSYAELWGVPLAIYGAAAYLVAFVLASLSVFRNRLAWTLFGVQVTLMALFSGWLIYVQAMLIEAFCQFCLLSAGTSFILFLIFLASLVFRRRPSV